MNEDLIVNAEPDKNDSQIIDEYYLKRGRARMRKITKDEETAKLIDKLAKENNE